MLFPFNIRYAYMLNIWSVMLKLQDKSYHNINIILYYILYFILNDNNY